MRYAVLVLILVLFIPACAASVEASTNQVVTTPFAAQYDTNGNNMIDKNEAIDAVIDYINGVITKEQAIEIIILFFSGRPIQEQAAPPSLAQVVAEVMPAVVKIVNDDARSQGSGVIYKVDGSNGYVITNQHVVRGVDTVTVTVGNTTDYDGTVRGVDVARDLAVVRICCNAGFPSVEFGDSEQLQIGDEVLAIGYPVDAFIPKIPTDAQPKVIVNPGEVSATVTRGIVSAVRYDSENDRELLQTDAPVNPGNSGGPLFSLDGGVMGINTFILRNTEGLNFAVLETTVQEQIPILEAGTSPGSSTPRLEFEFYPFAGPWPGHIHHEPDDTGFEAVRTRLWAADAVVAARFHNPYAGNLHDFDYGFILRDDRENPFVAFVVDSTREWNIRRRTATGYATVATGRAPGLATGAGWSNYLQVGVVGDWGWFDLNGEPLADNTGATFFRLGTGTHSGAVRLLTGFFSGDEQHGAETKFEEFLAHEVVTYSRLSTSADMERLVTAYKAQENSTVPVQALAPLAAASKD